MTNLLAEYNFNRKRVRAFYTKLVGFLLEIKKEPRQRRKPLPFKVGKHWPRRYIHRFENPSQFAMFKNKLLLAIIKCSKSFKGIITPDYGCRLHPHKNIKRRSRLIEHVISSHVSLSELLLRLPFLMKRCKSFWLMILNQPGLKEPGIDGIKICDCK